MNIVTCGQYNDLKKTYLAHKARQEMIRADKNYYLRITRDAAATLANNLKYELDAEYPNIPHCKRLIEELELATDMLSYLESLT